MSLARLKIVNTKDPYFSDLLKKIISRIVAIEPKARVLIFGSFVNGPFSAESDLDLGVIVPDHWKQTEFLNKLYSTGTLSTWPLDLVVIGATRFESRKDYGGVCVDIDQTGVEIYPNWSLN